MSRTLFLLTLLSLSLLYGGQYREWKYSKTFVLKKDQLQHVLIYDGEKRHQLSFRWTLYVNHGLVMHVDYDGHTYQPHLSTRYRLQRFKVDLFSKPIDLSLSEGDPPFALLIFKAFDEKKREAYLDLLIKSYDKHKILYE